MGRRKKKRPAAPGEAEPKLPKAPERLASPFADALRGMKADEGTPSKKKRPSERGHGRRDAPPPAPSPGPRRPEPPPRPEPEWSTYAYEDRVAMSQAYRDVRPIGDPRGRAGVRPPRRELATEDRVAEQRGDATARERLAALVAGGIRFDVRRDEDGRVEGRRSGTDPQPLRELRRGAARPDAELDLHGMRADQAEAATVRFVREEQRGGARIVRIVHGKGLHSDGGLGVLGDRVLHALTEGGAAPFVLAFVSAAPAQGGTGAVVVRLTR